MAEDQVSKNIREDRENYLRSREDENLVEEEINEKNGYSRQVSSSIAPGYRVTHLVEPVKTDREDGSSKVIQAIYYISGILIFLLSLRFLLLLFAARTNSIVSFVYQITDPLVAPFTGVFNSIFMNNGSKLEIASLFSIFAVVLLTFVFAGLFRLLNPNNTQT